MLHKLFEKFMDFQLFNLEKIYILYAQETILLYKAKNLFSSFAAVFAYTHCLAAYTHTPVI